MPVEDLEVLQTLINDGAVPDATDRVNSEHHRRVSSDSLHHHRYIINQARVHVCSGKGGGDEGHLLFYARYEET